MAEISQNSSVLEAELTELSRQIDEKRAQLEESRGMVVEHKEAIREVVGKEVFGESYVPTTAPPASQPTTPATSATPSKPSYLDRLDAQSVVIINELIQALPKDGLKKTIAHATAHCIVVGYQTR